MCMVLAPSLPAGLLVGGLGYSRVLMFVPEDFEPPTGFTTDRFCLEPLTVEHNEADFAAWSSSIEHIRRTPGFEGGSWPRQMTPEENAEDLAMHAKHFAQRAGFTYTVVDPAGDVIGCVYIFPVGKERTLTSTRGCVRITPTSTDHCAERCWLGYAGSGRSGTFPAPASPDGARPRVAR